MSEGRDRRHGMGATAGALAISAAFLLLASWAPTAGADSKPLEDLTFEGPAQLGGTISVTTTADHTGIVRAEADEVKFRILPPSGPALETMFSRILYFQPPVPITDGHFEFGLPGSLAGMVRDALRIEGAFLSDTEAAGTVTFVICMVSGCSDAAQLDWTAEGPVDTPPSPDDVAYYPALEGSEGSLVFTMDPSGQGVTSLVLKGVAFEPCTPADSPLSMRMFFEPAAPLEAGAGGLVQLATGLHPVSFEGSRLDAETLAGTITLRGLYMGDCEAQVGWTTGTVPTLTATATTTAARPSPTPGATPPPAGGVGWLPATGTGGSEYHLTTLLAGLAGSLLAVVAFGAGAVWHQHHR